MERNFFVKFLSYCVIRTLIRPSLEKTCCGNPQGSVLGFLQPD